MVLFTHEARGRVTNVLRAAAIFAEVGLGTSQGMGPKIPDHLFRGHFVSGSGGLGTRA